MSSPATAVTSSRSFSSRPRRRAPGSTRIGSGRSSPRSRSRTASPSLHPSASRASRTTKRPTRRTFSAPPTRHSTPRSVLGRTRSPRRARRRETHDMAQRDILIVDDDRQVREVLHQIFIAAGYNCLLANDGREGVEVFKAGRPPLVVTDLKTPGITGVELLQQVQPVDDDVAAIVMTGLAHGVLLHAIGKIGIPDAILLKPGPLTAEEWTIMRRHPEIGKALIERIPFLRGAVPVVWSHHEKWDGSGYPRGLTGEEIPLGARIFMVVDAFDAMTFDRPYSKAKPFDVAKTEIKRCAGARFDPAVVESFFRVPDALLEEIRRRSGEP